METVSTQKQPSRVQNLRRQQRTTLQVLTHSLRGQQRSQYLQNSTQVQNSQLFPRRNRSWISQRLLSHQITTPRKEGDSEHSTLRQQRWPNSGKTHPHQLKITRLLQPQDRVARQTKGYGLAIGRLPERAKAGVHPV